MDFILLLESNTGKVLKKVGSQSSGANALVSILIVTLAYLLLNPLKYIKIKELTND